MKIGRIQVSSFGKMKDRSFELDPELNVIYGPNEAGKSTLRSFITTTLFPRSGLRYPAQKGSDSGRLDVTLENGDHLAFNKDGKKSSGVGSELCGIDDKEYISIYSMSPEDLRDVKNFEKGGIRNRFLTIPGGADLPSAYAELDAERLEYLPESKRSSRCRMALLEKASHDAEMYVKELSRRESGDGNYAALVKRRKELEGLVNNSQQKVDKADAVRTASHRSEGNAGNLQKISELEQREKELAYAEKTDTAALPLMEKELERLTEVSKKAAEKVADAETNLYGHDPQAFIRNRKQIEYLDRTSEEYYYLKDAPQPVPPVHYEPPAKKLPVMLIAGAAIAVIGLVLIAAVNLYAGIAAVAVGAIAAFLGLKGNRQTVPVRPAPQQTPVQNDRVSYIERKMEEVVRDTGIEHTGFRQQLDILLRLLDASDRYNGCVKAMQDAESERKDAAKDVELFLSGYGGRESYQKAVKDRAELRSVRDQLKALKEVTSAAEVSDVDSETADADYQAALDEKNIYADELAKVKQAIKDISDNVTVEEAITAWSQAESEVYNAARDWARLMLEKIILDRASEKAYGSHRPDVLTRADAFLAAMTGGRYRMNTDPRETDISIIDTDTGEIKSDKEWSTGLEDQLKLSLKMAVSLSLSQERPPVILDDVLLTSDSERKKGACESLSLLSKDIQVLYFTCDRETRDLLENEGAKVIGL